MKILPTEADKVRAALIESGDQNLLDLAKKLDDGDLVKLRAILDKYPLQSDMPD